LADKRYLDRTGTSILTGPREFAGFRFNAGDLFYDAVQFALLIRRLRRIKGSTARRFAGSALKSARSHAADF
jgi:hypothetical protein